MNRDLIDATGSTPDHATLLKALSRTKKWTVDEVRPALARASSRWGRRPGIYAFYGDRIAWKLIEKMAGGLPRGYEKLSRPIYVGIHNDIVGRLSEHLSFCRPDSTYRCSLIALLRESEQWRTIAPRFRTDVKPTDYRLAPDENKRLNDWITEHLQVSVWASSSSIEYPTFTQWETQIIKDLLPPLNVHHGIAPTTFALRQARAQCALQATASPHMVRYLDGDQASLVPRRDIA